MSSRPPEQRSLFGEILDWMLAPLLLLWPMSIALTYAVAQGIANGPYDRDLGELAQSLARQVRISAPQTSEGPPTVSIQLPDAATSILRSDDVDTIYYQVLGVRGEFLSGDFDLPVPDETIAPDTALRFRDDAVKNEPVRVAYLWLPGPQGQPRYAALVQVASTLDKRSQLATEIVKGVILPQFIILPVAVVLVWFALARGIRPLSDLQQRIRRRESTDLSPIAERDVPDEVVPLVRSINELLVRLDDSMGKQKQFLADAAHQLKTPLAGLRMQAELAEREIDRGELDARTLKHTLQQIALSSQRAAHMVNQLLSMARAEDREHTQHWQPVDLAAVTTDVVRDFVPQALERRIDLGYEDTPAPGGTVLRGHPVLLREMVRNLVDNALRYTPPGGTVTARVMADPFGQVLVLQVEDNGPGVPPAERENVFRPFYRALGTDVDGSGLGLSIVHQIVRQHGAEITVEDAQVRPATPGRPGARFTIRFPLRPLHETPSDGPRSPTASQSSAASPGAQPSAGTVARPGSPTASQSSAASPGAQQSAGTVARPGSATPQG
jgi:two-component system sensor histidine kinase TctE